MRKKLNIGFALVLMVAVFGVMPGSAQAVPHFYSNKLILPEESGGPGAEGKDIIAFGTLVLQTKVLGPIICLSEYAGDVYNPVGGGAGEGKIDGWIPYDCTEETCEASFKSKPEIVPEGLTSFGEWETKLTEAVAGKIRLKWGNSTVGSPTQIKFLGQCPNTGLGEYKFKAKGELSPLTENGTSIGLSPSKQKFDAESGELEINSAKEGVVSGSLKVAGYEGLELISTKNP
jgi:hypothetical protein